MEESNHSANPQSMGRMDLLPCPEFTGTAAFFPSPSLPKTTFKIKEQNARQLFPYQTTGSHPSEELQGAREGLDQQPTPLPAGSDTALPPASSYGSRSRCRRSPSLPGGMLSPPGCDSFTVLRHSLTDRREESDGTATS